MVEASGPTLPLMRGIISVAGYVPYRRLQRQAISEVFKGAPGRGARSVASYDEDTTTMGVEAARLALRAAPPDLEPAALWFATADPGYLDKTNATTIHAALRLSVETSAFDMLGAVRSGVGVLRTALEGNGPVAVVTSDMRIGAPTGAEESAGGDGAAAALIGDDSDGPVIAEYLGGAGATEEFIDRWRTPGDRTSKVWEERFGETRYLPLGERAWNGALKQAGLSPENVERLIVTGMHTRAVRGMAGRLGASNAATVDDLSATVGNTGTAHPLLLLASALEDAEPGTVIAVVVLADGVDVLLFRATDAIASYRPARTVAAQVAAGGDIDYGKFLTWRGMVRLEPPRRPEPGRISASASGRALDWKYGFVGSRDRSTGALHLPPARVSRDGGEQDDMEPAPMADVPGTVASFTVDRIAYSPSPPITFAVVDFDGGGRHAVELTDTDAGAISVGDRVEMTFRKLFTADGIHNYFWKARPVRA
jgi:hydroxymethylglutaryl-CoA synthase